MKKESGVTIVSLILYVGALLIIAIIIGNITTFFYNNVSDLKNSSDYSSTFSKINLTLTRLFQEEDISGIDIGEYVINDESEYEFILSEEETGSAVRVVLGEGENSTCSIVGLIENQMYLNKVLIGNDTSSFSISESHNTVEDRETYTIDTKITIGTESYTHTYSSVVK